MRTPRFTLFLNLAHPNGYLRWAQSHYWHGLENGIAYKDHDELLRLWMAQTSIAAEVGREFRHRPLSGRQTSEMGRKRTNHRRPKSTFVRFGPIADKRGSVKFRILHSSIKMYFYA